MALVPSRPAESVQAFFNALTFGAAGGVQPSRVFQGHQVGFYFHLLDRFYWRCTGLSSAANYCYFDPLLLNPDNPSSRAFTLADLWDELGAGEWSPLAGTQAMYGTVGNAVRLVDPLTLETIDPDVWPNVGWESTRNGKSNTTDGWYGQSLSSENSHWTFFESLGYGIRYNCRVRFQGSTLSNVAARVDLATGDAVPEEEFRTSHASSPNAFQGGPILGETFNLRYGQFLPDDDTSPTRPKGVFLLFPERPSPNGPYWLKQIEWNPTNAPAAAGSRSRVHKRERLVTRVENIGGAAFPAGIGISFQSAAIPYTFLHPPSRSLRWFEFNNVSGTNQPNDFVVVTLTTEPPVAAWTAPTATREVLTGRVAEFSTIAYGSLGERIAGAEAAFTLERVSTIEELLDTSGGAGSSSAVAQVMDDDPDFQPEVLEDGTALTAGVDYTIDYGNNEVDFIAPKPLGGSVYVVSYRHRTDPASPAHGTLLTPFSRTDGDGAAVTRVLYAQDLDLVRQLDRLQVDGD